MSYDKGPNERTLYMSQGTDRREIPQRSSRWAAKSADILAAAKLTPNQISVGSVVFAAVGAAALIWSAHTDDAIIRAVLLAAAAACIPLRLLLNMLDGMLAVEKGMSSPVGDIYNELPDRISDVLFLGAAGIATAGLVTADRVDFGVTLGFLAAILAVLTAYIRCLGAALGTGNFFDGPLAKPHRMWLLMIGVLVGIAEPWLPWSEGWALFGTLALIALGSLLTCIRRLRRVSAALRARSKDLPS
ncbi:MULTISPECIES: CDP-alcohol phosphatidyltransferase family protein [unclassified Arthrobacter]|uniref:CDP-alcohol phosphatidyltransferase family protein n=1 Tax=unclassified Arthrobacter TaxID=235627 RepID=UPI002107B141|nr:MULTISPECIES: CDP-alcohol phosphatidyltransferase family protein [unclassified Arthrobacter]MCQ1948212.1 CDP-alcohol phosphatidyltransferase family protein [Arthrobacter sp. zg-Y1116]MCQ1996590.1 CDP-alcohol phosphatidyltransferase family protein [Arthrobacter sp. zg-Y1171]UWX82189.1 CDP-alcohol phosphatidyltransferase family protein [Arthrobacter sp. zg-Y1171]